MELLMLIGAAAFGVLLNILSNDLYDRCSKLAQRILRGALARLPEDQRERYAEEWAAIIMDAGSKTQQVWMATQFYFAAERMQPATGVRLDLNLVIGGALCMVLTEGVLAYNSYAAAPSLNAWIFFHFPIIPSTAVLIGASIMRREGRYTKPRNAG